MRHCPHDGRVNRRRHEHAVLLEAVDRAGAVRADVDLHEVRLDLFELDGDAGVPEPLGETTRTRVVVRDAVDVMVERVEAGGCDDPCLPIAALTRRAPSRWTARSCSRQVATIASTSSSGQTRPPALLCVFSIATRRVGATCTLVRSRISATTWSGEKRPFTPWRPIVSRPE